MLETEAKKKRKSLKKRIMLYANGRTGIAAKKYQVRQVE